jgi:hypothetical protein
MENLDDLSGHIFEVHSYFKNYDIKQINNDAIIWQSVIAKSCSGNDLQQGEYTEAANQIGLAELKEQMR